MIRPDDTTEWDALDAGLRSENVDRQRVACSAHVLKEENRHPFFHGAGSDLRDLKLGINLGSDPDQIALTFHIPQE